MGWDRDWDEDRRLNKDIGWGWAYRKKNNSRLSYVSVGVASELRKLGKNEKGNRWHRETRLGPFSPLNFLFSLASVETVRERLLQ